jgi:hypothetical protein
LTAAIAFLPARALLPSPVNLYIFVHFSSHLTAAMPSQSKNFYELVVTIAEEEDYNLENPIRQALKFFNNLGEGGASIKPDPAFAEDGAPTIVFMCA